MRLRRLTVAFCAFALGLVSLVAPSGPVSAQAEAEAPPADSLSVWRVYIDSPEEAQRLANSDVDLLEGKGDGYLFVLGENDVATELRQAGYRVQRDRELPALPGVARRADSHNHGELTASEAEAVAAATYYGGYRTVVEHYAHLDSVASTYPGLATVYDYGDSWLKTQNRAGANDLKVICLTNKQAGDCALSPNSAKPRAVIQAAIHARELQTSEIAWRLIDDLTQNYGVDADITHMMDTTEIWIIPVVNPDGREIAESGGNSPYMQRKNANDTLGSCSIPPTSSNHHGVDLNRNASTANWGGIGTTTNPCAQTYRGTGPASEPEQQALEALFRQIWPDQKGAVNSAAPDDATGTFITMHSSSELILLPPGEGGIAPNDAQLRAYAFRMSHYNGYETGTGPEILYGVTGSTDDWVYYDLGVASVTYELSPSSGTCGGFAPAYSCIDSSLWPLNRDALLYSIKVADTPYITSRGPTTTSASATGSVEQGTSVSLSAVVNDNAYGTSGFSRPTAQTVTQAEYYLDVAPSNGGTPIAMSSADGSFNENNETVSASIDTSGLALGDHTLFVRGRNAAGFWGPITAVSFTVTSVVDDPPTADDQVVSTPENTALAVTLTATDPEGQTMTYAVTSGPSNGSLSGSAPNLTYTPNAGFSGSDSFTFTASDGTNTSTAATVTIGVGVPIGPIFSDDFESSQGWTTNPSGTDTATTGAWGVSNPEQTSSGITLQLGTTVSGSQALVTDGRAGSSAGTYDIDNGTTSVRSPDVALPAGANLELSFSSYFAHLTNGTTEDFFRVTLVGSGGSQVIVEERGDGTEVAAVWAGSTTDISSFGGQTVYLLIEAADAGGGSLIEAGVDDVLIESLGGGGGNNAPSADSQSVTVDEGSSVTITLTGSDPDQDPLSYSVVSDPSNGTITGTAPNLTYAPNADYSGTDSFTFVTNDGTVNSATATVSITVNGVNGSPTALDSAVSTDEDTPVQITLTGSDPDQDPLTYTVLSQPSNGTVTGTAPNVTYTPTSGFVGTDTFQFNVDDGTNTSAAATVTVTVNAVGGGTLPFNDDFESGTSNWSSLGGSAAWTTTVSGSDTSFRGTVSGRNDSGRQAAGDVAWTDYTFEADVVTTSIVRRGDGPALLARVVDSNNYYVFRFDNRRWVIEAVVGGSVTKLAQSNRTTLSTGTVYTLRVDVEGSSLRFYVNGSLVTSATDTSFSSGQVGVGVYGATAEFDDVAVTSLP